MKICLCGSTKFKDDFVRINRMLSIAGHTVLTVASFGHQLGEELTEDEKIKLDLVHLQKILMCDAIFVVGIIKDLESTHYGWPYIGASTRREIMWARMHDKGVFYEPNNALAMLITPQPGGSPEMPQECTS